MTTNMPAGWVCGRGPASTFGRLARLPCSFYVPGMAANASARGQRAAILASPLHELTGFYLAVDCLTSDCARERTSPSRNWRASTVRNARWARCLRRMRCAGGCGGRVGAAWLVTGPILNRRVRPRRVPLLGPEARE